MDKLTLKQEGFVQSLVKGESQRQAYKDNYNAKKMTDKSIDETACKLLADTKVNSRYQELMNKLRDRLEEKGLTNAEDIIKSIIDIRTRCMQGSPVMVGHGKDKVESGEWEFDASNALRSNELLGKNLNMWTDKKVIDHNVSARLEDFID